MNLKAEVQKHIDAITRGATAPTAQECGRWFDPDTPEDVIDQWCRKRLPQKVWRDGEGLIFRADGPTGIRITAVWESSPFRPDLYVRDERWDALLPPDERPLPTSERVMVRDLAEGDLIVLTHADTALSDVRRVLEVGVRQTPMGRAGAWVQQQNGEITHIPVSRHGAWHSSASDRHVYRVDSLPTPIDWPDPPQRAVVSVQLVDRGPPRLHSGQRTPYYGVTCSTCGELPGSSTRRRSATELASTHLDQQHQGWGRVKR